MKHPVDYALETMNRRDLEIANELYEAGFSDEDLYAALPNPRADKLLTASQRVDRKTANAKIKSALAVQGKV